MGMNLNDFFDLDKVQFTDSELEAPYESYDFSKLMYKNFSYSQSVLPSYNSLPPKKVVLRVNHQSSTGVAA